MQTVRALIVDDEPLARRELRRLLGEHAWVEIIGEAANVEEALAQVRALTPDLIFLDIQMPGGTGFDLLDRLDSVPEVIFTTAYDQHAVRAFEVNALDYLLKPVEPERLAAALERVSSASSPTTGPTGSSSGASPDKSPAQSPADILERIFVRDGERCWFVPLREVSLLSSEGNYVRLHWGKSLPLLARSLALLEHRLEPTRFFRANRAQIINLDFVQAVDLGIGGRLLVRLKEGVEVEISRRQALLFRRRTTL